MQSSTSRGLRLSIEALRLRRNVDRRDDEDAKAVP
jgi:hypothetical protein